jgi:hypothetical protein
MACIATGRSGTQNEVTSRDRNLSRHVYCWSSTSARGALCLPELHPTNATVSLEREMTSRLKVTHTLVRNESLTTESWQVNIMYGKGKVVPVLKKYRDVSLA